MSALICGRCPATAMPARVQGLMTDPPGWSNITITGRPILNVLLCPSCTTQVRAVVAASPALLEAERDAALELSFSRGYDEGRVDTLAAAAPGEVPA